MHVTLSPVPIERMAEPASAERSAVFRTRVDEADQFSEAAMHGYRLAPSMRRRNAERFGLETDEGARRVLHAASRALGLSARGFEPVLRVARTIADLAESARIFDVHVAEALRYWPQ